MYVSQLQGKFVNFFSVRIHEHFITHYVCGICYGPVGWHRYHCFQVRPCGTEKKRNESTKEMQIEGSTQEMQIEKGTTKNEQLVEKVEKIWIRKPPSMD